MERTVIIEFDSVDEAVAAYHSPATRKRCVCSAMEPSAIIHFSFDNDTGLVLGRRVGRAALTLYPAS